MTVMLTIPRTTDEDALLAAIAAAPLDDAPRLVYADWLQDRGEDAKAEYLRTVVTLLHPPENSAAVERCLALAEELDAGWRQTVGGRFEVVLAGSLAMDLVFHLLRFAVGWIARTPVGLWHAGEPIRLQESLTREAAASFLDRFEGPIAHFTKPYDPTIRMFIRPMEEASPLGLFVPADW
jgi:uncharacterized protein (TIGR02996 family)